jgi:hypothetical protein
MSAEQDTSLLLVVVSRCTFGKSSGHIDKGVPTLDMSLVSDNSSRISIPPPIAQQPWLFFAPQSFTIRSF